MKTILHPDYWVEIPAGEFLIGGFSPSQEEWVSARLNKQYNHNYYPYWKKNHLWGPLIGQRPAYLDRFYIARFPISGSQHQDWYDGKSVPSLLGALEYSRYAPTNAIGRQEAEPFCKEIGARLPSDLEWEKSARGTDGRLYPWGDDWDAGSKYLVREHRGIAFTENGIVMEDYLNKISPYGLYGLLGSLPQLTVERARGCDPRETTPETAWIDNMLLFARLRGDYVTLRPVLDKWPVQQWQGHTVSKDQTN